MTKKELSKTLSAYPEALNIKEVAEILRISTKTAYKLIACGEIPAIKVGRENRIAKSHLIGYLRKSTNPKCVVSENSSRKVWTFNTACDIVLTTDKNIGGSLNEKHIIRKRTG